MWKFAFANFLSLTLLVALVSATGGCSQDQPVSLSSHGSPSADYLLDLTGRHIKPQELIGGQVMVFIFTRFDCPVANRYAPEIRRIYEIFAPRQVEFRLVYLDPDQSVDMIRKHLSDYNYPCQAIRDPHHVLVSLTRAERTPEAAVFRADTEMVYCGRIDNWYADNGQSRPAPTQHDLIDALEATLQGRAVEHPRTKAVGCIIADLK
tara:strand:- start:1218 stop:1838 length:621 start_codon:yes stop_codon:yes gene_type:complete